jgi:hypothetical protein
MNALDPMARRWLARSLAAAGPALRALATDPAMAVADAPTPAELASAATTIERAAHVLHHAAGSAGA